MGRGPAVYWDHDKDHFVAVGDDDYVDPGAQPAVEATTLARYPNAHYLVRSGSWTLELGAPGSAAASAAAPPIESLEVPPRESSNGDGTTASAIEGARSLLERERVGLAPEPTYEIHEPIAPAEPAEAVAPAVPAAPAPPIAPPPASFAPPAPEPEAAPPASFAPPAPQPEPEPETPAAPVSFVPPEPEPVRRPFDAPAVVPPPPPIAPAPEPPRVTEPPAPPRPPLIGSGTTSEATPRAPLGSPPAPRPAPAPEPPVAPAPFEAPAVAPPPPPPSGTTDSEAASAPPAPPLVTPPSLPGGLEPVARPGWRARREERRRQREASAHRGFTGSGTGTVRAPRTDAGDDWLDDYRSAKPYEELVDLERNPAAQAATLGSLTDLGHEAEDDVEHAAEPEVVDREPGSPAPTPAPAPPVDVRPVLPAPPPSPVSTPPPPPAPRAEPEPRTEPAPPPAPSPPAAPTSNILSPPGAAASNTLPPPPAEWPPRSSASNGTRDRAPAFSSVTGTTTTERAAALRTPERPAPAPEGEPRDKPWPTAAPPLPVPSRRRSQPTRWGAIALVIVVVAAAVGVGIFLTSRSSNKSSSPKVTFPAAFDSRVSLPVQFVEREKQTTFRHPVAVDFVDDNTFSQRVHELDANPTDAVGVFLQQPAGVLRALGIAQGPAGLSSAIERIDNARRAIYSPTTQRITVRGTTLDQSTQAGIVRALTLALDQQLYGVTTKFDNDQAAWAYGAVREGDATRVQNAYIDALDSAEQATIADPYNTTDPNVNEASRALARSASVLGEQLVAAAQSRGGANAVAQLFAKPPTTEEQVYDPTKYYANEQAGKVDTPKLEAGESQTAKGTLGVLPWLVVMGEHAPANVALKAADGWGGDQAVTYQFQKRDCIRANWNGDAPSDVDEMSQAAQAWTSSMSPGNAQYTNQNGTVAITACDPGAGTALTTGKSKDAFGLVMFRAAAFERQVAESVPVDKAWCVARQAAANASPQDVANSSVLDSTAYRQKISQYELTCA